MAEFKISRLRYTWRSAWETETDYIKDDVVQYGGSSWVCIRAHTASDFESDQTYFANEGDTDPSPAWIKMMDGYAWKGNWASTTLYEPGDLALYGGVIYVCTDNHTSDSVFATNSAKWDVYLSLHNWTFNWVAATRYGIGDFVQYNGVVYRCITEHTSSTVSNGLETDQDKWQIVHSGIEYKGAWATETRYRPNDLVKYGGTILRCITGHTAGATIDSSKFQTEFFGFNAYQEWTASRQYAIGDTVRHGGYLYRAVANNVNSNPGNLYDALGSTDWEIISKGVRFLGEWSSAVSYKTGDVVNRGGRLLIALKNSDSDGSSLDYLEPGNWEVVIDGDKWENFWSDDSVSYAVGDVVIYEGSVYRCNYEHFSSHENYPGDNGSGYAYWDLILAAYTDTGLKQKGDLLTYNLDQWEKGDGSSFGNTNTPIGEVDQLLSINNEETVYYKTWGNLPLFVYVSNTQGVDDVSDVNRGYNYFKPWKTIRYACEQIDAAGINETRGVVVKIWPGVYEEVLPIIIPANVSIQGDETRVTTVKPKPANPALANDSTYTKAVLARLSAISANIIIGVDPTPSVGNTEEISHTYMGTVETAAAVQSLFQTMISYINYHVNDSGTNPTVIGTNTATTDQTYLDTVLVLEDNIDFLTAEAVAFVQATYPAYTFDSTSCARDARRFVEAIIYDITYTGNYKSILAARYYSNAVNGSAHEDMFYCRNATGVRNMTLTGLQGELADRINGELYQRPTGGAYCSLDPGWGPDDERTWIHSRSPYLQNCATFGSGCVGQKIDGSLHNGGYKSMVSNDYTQLISDGIGAWVSNNGRAELVSVFTYYAHIGMFTEQGGIIRSTNGNSSYGTYGTISDGNDPTEVPEYGFVNNRLTQADVISAFAGEVNDEILIFEFGNAGQNYTQANYTIVGSGTNASVIQDEFRDNAISQALVRNPLDDPGGTPGGLNYILRGNNAQSGNATTITIASNDEGTEEEYLGLRIIITSGTGTGQYGYVQAFNPVTKVVTVYRESDGKPGWDHVIPGYPTAPLLVTSTTYKFEPRPIFAAPPYSSTDVNLVIGQIYGNVIYGETTETYTGIEGTAGEGTTNGVTPVEATWNIVKVGRTYEVELATGGAGYEAGQFVTISGGDIGGVDGENDIRIAVRTVSDDSTNSILTFDYEGIGASGRFVATPASGNVTVYSIDGSTWEDGVISSSGNWNCLAAGNNRFVALKTGTNKAAYSYNGISWTEVTLPISRAWTSVVHGNGVFVAVSGNLNGAVFSSDGISWSSVSLPEFGDSTYSEWVDVAYGKNKFVALSNSGNYVGIGEYNSETESWSSTATIMDVIEDSSERSWRSIAYGNGRFVAIADTGEVAYSFDTQTWYPATLPTPDGSTVMTWSKIRYGQGIFIALCNTGGKDVFGDTTTGPTTFAAQSHDGIVWEPIELSEEATWASLAFGNPDITLGDSTTSSNSTPMWIILSSDESNVATRVRTGARARGRAWVEGVKISEIRLWDPGSGYDTVPNLTIIDPNSTVDAYVDCRINDGVLAQPAWLSRGTSYRTSTTQVTILGDGFADRIPDGNIVSVSGLSRLPGPGTQFRFRGEQDRLFTVVRITFESTQLDSTVTANFQISPSLDLDYNLEHNAQVEIRTRYSQCRITGHDFLDVGSGNFEETNYPELYSRNDYFYAPENEIAEFNGGRVFYTSTDQSGNFRAGELFAVDQATGTVTISAEFFELEGLTELALGGVRLGGSGAVVREFSTDPNFTADSNNVVPTQRAIRAYLQSRLNVGGSDLATASFIAGTVLVGPNLIRNSANLTVLFPAGKLVKFEGDQAGLAGSIIAQDMFYKSFNDRTS